MVSVGPTVFLNKDSETDRICNVQILSCCSVRRHKIRLLSANDLAMKGLIKHNTVKVYPIVL